MPRKKATDDAKSEAKRPTRSRSKKQEEPPLPQKPPASKSRAKSKKTFEKDEKAPRSVTSSPRGNNLVVSSLSNSSISLLFQLKK